MKTHPLIIAHRGASYDAPENTMASFERAWAQGADGIEGDFHLTADGQVVCIHDADTARVSGKSLAVKGSTLADLQKLDVGRYRGIEFEGEKIPTFERVLESVPPGKQIYIEVKCGVEILPPMLEIMVRSGLAADQLTVISFNRDVIRELKTQGAPYKAFLLASIKHDEKGEMTPSLPELVDLLRTIAADGLSSNVVAISRETVDFIRGAGFEYHVWTVDDPDIAERLAGWGVKSVTTNRPGFMRQHTLFS